MPPTDQGATTALQAIRSAIATVAAFTADPAAAGSTANEVTGGSYQRESMTFNPATGRAMDSLAQPAINIPAGTTVTHVGFMNTGGGMEWRIPLPAPQTFTQAGVLNLDDVDLSVA